MDLYAVLGLTPTADGTAVRDAYRRLAKLYHPDVSALPDAHQRFIRITEAYEVLGHPDRRRRYDLLRQGRNAPTPPPRRQARYAEDVRRYQREARARAQRYGQMEYERFQGDYFRTVFAYTAPKVLGFIGILAGVVGIIGLALVALFTLPVANNIRFPLALLLVFGSLPLVAWLSMHFDQWHNERQMRRHER